MTNALYNKWRPQKWDEVVGQQHVIQTLRNAVAGGHVMHAYLFAGPRGTGKTTAARLLAKAVNCLDPLPANRPCNQCAHCRAVNEGRFLDLIEIDAASQTGVDDVRDLRDKINFSPNQGQYKIYIIDEVHMFSNSAFNALLKTLEEPPPHAIFILATTEMHKIPPTVLSRCQRYEFRRVSVDDIVRQLERIVETEKLQAEPEALRQIARQSAGGLRDAISLLDQMASTGKEITLGLTQAVLGTATSQTVVDLVQALLGREPKAGMDAIHAALDSGSDPRFLARQVVDYLRALLLIQMGNGSQVDQTDDIRRQAEEHAKALAQMDVLRMIKAFNAAASDLRGGWQPSLPLELALAESLETLAEPPKAPPAAPRPIQPPPAAKPEKPPAMLYQGVDVREKAAPVPATKPEQKPAGTAEAGLTLAHVIKNWKQVGAALKFNNSLAALLNSCRLIELKNNTLTLGFASDILRKKTDTPEQIALIRKAIKEVLGEDLAIRCVVTSGKQDLPPSVKPDGMVAAALKNGGEIVDTQE